MRLSASKVKQTVPLWQALKDADAIQVGKFSFTPLQRIDLLANGKILPALVIGPRGDDVLLAVIRPAGLQTELHSIPVEDLGKSLGGRPATIKRAYRGPVTVDRRKLLVKLRSFADWAAYKGFLWTADPDLFIASYNAITRTEKSMALAETLISAYTQANDRYHNGQDSNFEDAQFDRLKEILTEESLLAEKELDAPGAAPKTGAGRAPKQKIPGPPMGSLDKAKTVDELAAWHKKIGKDQHLIMTPKIDGISLRLVYKRLLGGPVQFAEAFTRGDGTVGQNVTRHVEAMLGQDLPRNLVENHAVRYMRADTFPLYIRAEAYMEKGVFESKYAKLTKPDGTPMYANPRNTVAGQFNRGQPDTKILKDIRILCYHSDGAFVGTKYGRLHLMERAGLPVAKHEIIQPERGESVSVATGILERFRRDHDFEMDGLVVEMNDDRAARKLGNERSSLNPASARAYKPADVNNVVRVVVKEVTGRATRTGYIFPRVWFDPVKISGVMVRKASGKNYGFIRDNKIGPGAVIEVTRGGDVIPDIVRIIKSAKQAALPDPAEFGEWEWSKTGVDAVLVKGGDKSDAHVIRELTHFFVASGVDGVSEGTVRKFYKAGYTSTDAILRLSVADMLELPGVQEKSAEKMRAEFDRCFNGIALPRLMYASNCFGRAFGRTKLAALYDEYKDALVTRWLGRKPSEIAAEISGLSGFSFVSGKQFAAGIKAFRAFMAAHRGLITVAKYANQKTLVVDGPLSGEVITPSEYRDAMLAEAIRAKGGEYNESFTGKTTIVIIPDASINTVKVQKARAKKLPVMTVEQFRKKYRL